MYFDERKYGEPLYVHMAEKRKTATYQDPEREIRNPLSRWEHTAGFRD